MIKYVLLWLGIISLIFLPFTVFGQESNSTIVNKINKNSINKNVYTNDVKDEVNQSSGEEDQEHKDLFVHPFFAHMALADDPGTVSFRFSGLQFREGNTLTNDFAYHIEAGLIPNLGIHLRSDGVKHESYSEMMLMYNVFTTENENFGISIFGQVSIPTGSIESNTYKGLFGIGIKQALPPYFVFNGDLHYDAKDKMAEYEGSIVFRASGLFYPIIEGGGEITSSGTTFYLLPGIKFRIKDNQTIGLGFKGAITKDREYDVLTVLQYGIEF